MATKNTVSLSSLKKMADKIQTAKDEIEDVYQGVINPLEAQKTELENQIQQQKLKVIEPLRNRKSKLEKNIKQMIDQYNAGIAKKITAAYETGDSKWCQGCRELCAAESVKLCAGRYVTYKNVVDGPDRVICKSDDIWSLCDSCISRQVIPESRFSDRRFVMDDFCELDIDRAGKYLVWRVMKNESTNLPLVVGKKLPTIFVWQGPWVLSDSDILAIGKILGLPVFVREDDGVIKECG